MQANTFSQAEFLAAAGIGGLCPAQDDTPAFAALEGEGRAGADETRIVKTCCRACIANCGVLATVRNGRVVKLQGNPEDPMSKGRMCAKGLSGIQALYHPNRNKYPLIRAGERGENKWRRASWDEALEYIAKGLMKVREQYGAEAVACSTGGGGNPEIWSIARFCNIFGTPNWFEPGCAQCYLPRVLAYTMMYGGVDPSIADSNALELYFPDETPIKTLVLWGTAPSYSCPASGGGMVSDLRAKGVKTVVVDPRMTPDAAKSDVWLPIRPGSDVALMLAWIRYILEHKLFDRDFVRKWTNLPYLVDVESKMLLRAEKSQDPDEPDTFVVWDQKTAGPRPLPYPWDDALDPALEGTFTVDGRRCKTGFQLLWERVQAYTLEKAAELCWLDAERIERAIRLFTDNSPSGLAIGVATDQGANSVQAAMAAATIDLLMGNVERPGALLQRFRTSGLFDMPNYPVPIAARMLPEEQLKKRLGANEHKGLHIWFAGHPSSIRDAMITGKPYPVKAWIDRSGNKLGAVADSQSWLPAIENMDLIVHMYTTPTSFSAYADVLLPAEEWLETDMMVETCNKLFARQAATHLWETMDETLFWSRLAKKCAELGHERCRLAFDPEFMGKDLAYWDSMDEFFTHFTSRIGLTWKQFKEKAPFEYLPRDQWRSYYVYRQNDPKTGKPGGFATPSKKLELYLESMITLSRTGKPFSLYELPPASRDYDPLPYYFEPYESPIASTELAKEYPLVLTSGRVPFYHHGTLRNIPWLREIYPAPELWIHPTAAGQCGVADGDWVWVASQRGRTQAIARVTEGINPGTVCMERFWNPEKLNTPTHGWREMNVNMLTKADAPFNDVVGTYTLRGFLVKVTKAEGPPEGVWLKPEDFKPWLPQPTEPTPEVRV
ncbi:molybdopterin-dependent oxidoreductase [Flavonifractor sp. DFI.6.63]|uniref:molybdopterin-containing oxidoreductase family protein n=1 Tax=Flavonifractor sp. DFI.6.63 TaxID=2963704 RepID=UPI00210DD8AA|nr:molybdopterin-dependent oxidoreductase [Flavonifractor sp. DFI.6.63]MCQ5028050.1 molybdopterin-dependent oxidoreductase [Flavonifractor sp. DFI.6.63]